MSCGFKTWALVAVCFLVGCNQGGFTGGGAKSRSESGKSGGKDSPDDVDRNGKDGKDGPGDELGNPGEIDAEDGEDAGGVESGGDNDSGGLDETSAEADPNGLLVDDEGVACVKELLPLHVMFAIDTTASMDDEIEAVAQNVAQFATSVQNLSIPGTTKKIPEVKVGAVAYVDQPSQHIVLELGNPQTFASQVADLDTRGGINDHCEGGIQAAYTAVERLSNSGKSFKVMIVISDNYSHDGSGSNGSRGFDMSVVANGVKIPALNNLMVFDSVPTDTDVPTTTSCNVPGGTPADQWVPVRDAWRSAHPKVKIENGRNLGFPFTGGTLSSVLPAEIAKLVRVCK